MSPIPCKRTVFFISDSTGITAEALGRALLAQFERIEFEPVFLPFTTTKEQAREAVRKIDAAASSTGRRPIIFDTIVKPEIRQIIDSSQGMVTDFLSTFIGPLEEELGAKSSYSVGTVHRIDSKGAYDRRIEAVNFSMAHDDGVAVKGYANADLILVGVSRCGKTPTSLFIAMQFGVKVANYPFTEDDLSPLRLPDLLTPHKPILFGLTIDPNRLHEIRTQRRAGSRYASLQQCRIEVREVEALYAREGIPSINTTKRSVEEIASKILSQSGIQRKLS